jgi:hypothetical protein
VKSASKLKEEHRLKVQGKKVGRGISGQRESNRKYGENCFIIEHNIKQYYADQIIDHKMGGICSTYRDINNALNISVGRPEYERPLGRPRRRWKKNIGTDLKEVCKEALYWMHLALDKDQ